MTTREAQSLNIAITGTSQGIGLDAAKRLLGDGHTVYHLNRNQERSNEAVKSAGGGIPMVCDLASFESIRACSENFVDQNNLDALCLNAAIAPSTSAATPKLTVDGLEECIGVNHLGHFLLANLLHNKINRLIVTASSVHDPEAPGGAVGGEGGATLGDLSGLGVPLANAVTGSKSTMVDGSIEYNGGKVYKDSKLCNVLFCREALKRWPNVDIRSFNPGFIPSSGLFREPRKDDWLKATAFTWFAGFVGFAVPIEIGGARLAYMATADSKEVPSGSYFSADVGSNALCKKDGFQDAKISKEASNDELASNLWTKSAEIVGV